MKVRLSLCCGFVVLLAGCGDTGVEEMQSEYSYEGAPATASEDGNGVISVASSAPSLGGPAAAAGEEAPDPIKRAGLVDRKIIYVADVKLVVNDFANTEREVPNLVKQFDGYLADASINRTQGDQRSGRWVARVPVENFDPFLEALEKLGVPESRNQTAQDLTEVYVDLQSRISNKKRLEERILDLLEDLSGKITDVIEVERELARVREEIERMEGRLRYLANRTSLTTVTITAREQRDYVPPQTPTFTAQVSQTWNGSLLSVRRFGEFATISLVALAPWLVLLIPAVWILIKFCKTAIRKVARHPHTEIAAKPGG